MIEKNKWVDVEREDMRRNMVLGIIAISCVAIGVGLSIGHFAIKNIFFARRKTEEEAFNELEHRKVYKRSDYEALSKEEITITSQEGYKLQGEYITFHPDAKKVVLLIHGYTGNHLMSLQVAQIYGDYGYNILAIDARSHGKSEGIYPTYGLCEVEDARLWINKLREIEGETVRIGLHGQSMGAATALMYAGRYKDIAFVVADCPYTRAMEVLQYQFKTFAHLPAKLTYKIINFWIKYRYRLNLDEANPLDEIIHYNGPVAFIHGKEDVTIPYTMSERMYKARNSMQDRLCLIEGAKHVEAYMYDKVAYQKAIHEIINS